ncbi:hypothetical protein PpBr36_04743, partial [Pyricularia pennisetigena]|uniref:hypothetical protein n=1 Tax=Pyricularia pennisetigena TaxID=1578925 RepID=UPI0011525C0A
CCGVKKVADSRSGNGVGWFPLAATQYTAWLTSLELSAQVLPREVQEKVNKPTISWEPLKADHAATCKAIISRMHHCVNVPTHVLRAGNPCSTDENDGHFAYPIPKAAINQTFYEFARSTTLLLGPVKIILHEWNDEILAQITRGPYSSVPAPQV